MTQPEALRLAERLERYDATRSGYAKHCSLAAAELRRQHEVNQELLAELKAVYTTCDWHGDDGREAMTKAKGELK
jgi:hypothetical protein